MSETGIKVMSEQEASAARLPVPPDIEPEKNLTPAQWGVIAFLVSEVALFGTLITTFLTYLHVSDVSPTPKDALNLGALVFISSALLLSSSLTIHLAEKALHHDNQAGFRLFWGLTILLGTAFLVGTGIEWLELIHHPKHPLTISRNLFGSTYYLLVGFHAFHVTGGVIVMTIILGLALQKQITRKNGQGVQLVSWYWHFVDVVWIVVFFVVYIVPRL